MSCQILPIFFAIFIVLQRSSVESLDLQVLSMGNRIDNQRIASRIPHETEEYTTTTSCSGLLTQAPGEIKQKFDARKRTNAECTWKIHAPANHSIYIRSFETSLTTFPGGSIGDLTDSVELQIYDGHSASSSKRLFNSKRDYSLDKCISNGQWMTLVLNYAESGLHAYHEITLEYGFADRSQISDLIN